MIHHSHMACIQETDLYAKKVGLANKIEADLRTLAMIQH